MKISFLEIKKFFDEKNWIISYLTKTEIQEILNFPIKMGENYIEKLGVNNYSIPSNYFLIFLKYSPKFDYTIDNLVLKKLNNQIKDLKIEPFWCNYKYAAVKAGLGQYAKNSLIFNEKFEFDFHIGVFSINYDLIDLPLRKEPNFNLLNSCLNCNDCISACPVNAINFNHNFSWVNLEKCDIFCHFGDHEYIPSLKYGWFNYNLPVQLKDKPSNFLKEKLKNSKNFEQFKINFPGQHVSMPLFFKNKEYKVIYPVCRECTSQKCTKYKGKFPYNNQEPEFIEIERLEK